MNLIDTIEATRDGFNKIDRIDPCSPTYKKMIDLLDRADDEAIQAIAGAGIKFVSKLAVNRCVRRGLV